MQKSRHKILEDHLRSIDTQYNKDIERLQTEIRQLKADKRKNLKLKSQLCPSKEDRLIITDIINNAPDIAARHCVTPKYITQLRQLHLDFMGDGRRGNHNADLSRNIVNSKDI